MTQRAQPEALPLQTVPPCTSGSHHAVQPHPHPGGSPQAGPCVLAADVDAFNLLLEMKLKRRRERPQLPRTVTELEAEDGSRVYVVGTAHFSDDSKRDVVKVTAVAVVGAQKGHTSRHQGCSGLLFCLPWSPYLLPQDGQPVPELSLFSCFLT